MSNEQKITFTVGAEKKLQEILSKADVMPLLRGAVKAGAFEASLTDRENRTLWTCTGQSTGIPTGAMLPFLLEGEVVGAITVKGHADGVDLLQGLASLLRDALSTVMHNNLKRSLATELHTNVVNLSYDELLETNNKLRTSESKYRELAENLEAKVTERTEELRRVHARILQQEKMVSVGQLAAGVAHEINNPLGYIASNLNSLQRYVSRLNEMLAFYDGALNESGIPKAMTETARKKRSALKLDFILSDAFQLIDQSLTGAEKVKKIVSDLKDFSQVDDAAIMPADVNSEIDKTLNVLAHQTPQDARIIRNYGTLRPVVCQPALLCQVFYNIITNAFQTRSEGLELSISTSDMHKQGVMIRFADNGAGVPQDIRKRIFDPFFTTKGVGKGTGTGLTVAHEIMTAFGGSISLDETPQGSGASFTLTLPIKKDEHNA